MPVTTQTPGEPPRHEVIYNREERREDRPVTGEQRAELEHEERVSSATMVGGSSLELIGGGGALVLSIIGLIGGWPLYMTSISSIAIGGALLAHGGAVTARLADTMRRAGDARAEQAEIAGGASSEFIGGGGALTLGILALANVAPLILLPIAAIVVGGAILLGAPAQPAIARLVPGRERPMSRITYEAVEGASGTMVLSGLASIVLGILALVGVGPVFTLVLVAMLVVGGSLLISGSAMTTRFTRRLMQA